MLTPGRLGEGEVRTSLQSSLSAADVLRRRKQAFGALSLHSVYLTPFVQSNIHICTFGIDALFADGHGFGISGISGMQTFILTFIQK
jgi:hypothetical protein